MTTDTWGVSSHGVKSLRGYVRRLRGGGLKVDGRPKVVAEGPAWAQVDGDNSLGMVTECLCHAPGDGQSPGAAASALATVREQLPFRRRRLLSGARRPREGFIALAMANDIPSVTAPGAARRHHRQQSVCLWRADLRRSDRVGHGQQHGGRRKSDGGPLSQQADSGSIGSKTRPASRRPIRPRFLPAARCSRWAGTKVMASRC